MTSRTSARGISRVVEIRRADLHVDGRLQLLNQRGLAQQRLELRSDLLPLGVGDARQLRLAVRASAGRRSARAAAGAD